MSKFTKIVSKTYMFDGDQIMVNFSRLSRADALKITPYIKTDENGKTKMTFSDSLQMAEVGCEILSRNIHDAVGLTIGGVVQTKEQFIELLKETYFFNLLSSLINDLIEASFINEAVEKK